MKDPQPNHKFLEKYKKVISENKQKKQKAIWRGLIFLSLLALVTYIGKVKPRETKIVNSHDLLGWIFLKDHSYSLFLVLPNDGDYSNKLATGERVYFNPHPHPGFLDSNHILYHPRSLFLMGQINKEMISAYCSKVDSGQYLYFNGPSQWQTECPKAKIMESQAFSLFEDMSLESGVHWNGDGKVEALDLAYGGQHFRVAENPSLCEGGQKSLQLCVALKKGPSPQGNLGLFLAPGQALVKGKLDSNLVLNSKTQALGFRVLKNGELQIKKLWLSEINPHSF